VKPLEKLLRKAKSDGNGDLIEELTKEIKHYKSTYKENRYEQRDSKTD